jgi:thermostable 8-oxoguanine DNA glycosylase
MTTGMDHFRLQFASSQIPRLAARYSYGTPAEAQRERLIIEKIGPAAKARGCFTRDEFILMCRWKTRGRSAPLVEANTSADIEEATRIALSATTEVVRIGVLRALSGIDWSSASVFLHFGHVEPYPILDFRTLEALGIARDTVHYTCSFWSEYVAYCRRLATQAGVSMRELDRAMWQWSNER